ncbi:hypothetical protein QCA50_008961 [Cerrena zonata]|uniref:Uncharacterized protein n=1 Tax=Cerrena zonata TaxID=2478898 RepID=A0AAW0G1X8_9APHY
MLMQIKNDLPRWQRTNAQALKDLMSQFPMLWKVVWEVVIPSGLLDGYVRNDEGVQVDNEYHDCYKVLCIGTTTLYSKLYQYLPSGDERYSHVMLYFRHNTADLESRMKCLRMLQYSQGARTGEELDSTLETICKVALIDKKHIASITRKIMDDFRRKR